MTNPLLLISVDQLNANDFEVVKDLPVFQSLMKRGSYVRSVDSVYPSLTYCCHTTLATGCHPCKHGIYHNEKFNHQLHDKQDWFWYSDAIKRPTIFDLASKKKMKIATLLWPVTGGSKSIQNNIPEIWSNTGVSSFKLFLDAGSWKLLPFVARHQHLLDGKKQPNVDNFTEAVAKDLLRLKKLDLMAIHLTELDDTRHKKGTESQAAYDALKSSERRLEAFFDILKKKGTYDKTNIIVFGDHGGNDFEYAILLNKYFADEGLLTLGDDGHIRDYICYANGAGGSCQVHLMHPESTDDHQRVSKLLSRLSMMPGTPVSGFMTRKQALEQHHLFGDFSFVLEAKDGYVFKNLIRDNWIIPKEEIGSPYVSDHGYMPSHSNMKTMMFAMGPDIKKGIVMDRCHLADMGATFAKLLGVELPDPDGQLLTDILR